MCVCVCVHTTGLMLSRVRGGDHGVAEEEEEEEEKGLRKLLEERGAEGTAL